MSRIHWNEDQIESLAKAFVRLRLTDPFITVHPLLQKVQEECLTEDLHRELASVKVEPRLYDRIRALWAKTVTAAPPPPTIIEIPVETPIDYGELANRLDLPTLMALVTKKIAEALSELRFSNVTEHRPAPTKAAPPISFLAPPTQDKTRPPRVAFCSADPSMFTKVREEVEKTKIAVELRGVNIDHRPASIPLSVDFVVFPQKATGGPTWKTALSTMPDKRVFVVPNNVEAIVQKMRDIASRQVHVPAHTPAIAQARA